MVLGTDGTLRMTAGCGHFSPLGPLSELALGAQAPKDESVGGVLRAGGLPPQDSCLWSPALPPLFECRAGPWRPLGPGASTGG